MDKKKKIAMLLLILAVTVTAVLCFLILDELAAQLICILTAMILAAVVLVLSMDYSALHALVLAAATAVCVPFLKFFEHSEFAARLCGRYNNGTAFVCARMGMEAPKEMGSQTALIITFWIIFALTYLIVWGVRSLLKGKSAANAGGSEADKDFPEKNYQQKRKSFCKFLAKRIDAINEETNWSEETFTPIEAEVEMTDKRRKKRRYEDLHKCLRRHRRKNTVFLVLGDPGSGKSVSMRKLCAEMLKEADKADLIPVYVDLKKWTEDWSLERRPTEEDLIEFIEQRILREGGTTCEYLFLDTYFRKMLERGDWYFIFDSFDEIPCLMGRRSCQELIDHISSLLHTFLTRENQHGGVIASRLFRAPTDALHAAIKLNLQPFSDVKIKKMLNLRTNNSDELVRVLFGSREDLVALCRNPFYLSLMIEYSMNHGAALPENQMELYEDFIESRLGRCAGRIEEEGLTAQKVCDAARQLALHMQDSSRYGLECPVSELYRSDDRYDWYKILDLLRYAKLCHFGGASLSVSFVHRRFQECFYVSSIKKYQIGLGAESYRSIERNNGIRDALVLYSEIASLEKAREIADHCWSILQAHKAAAENIRNPGCVELVNTLYFMVEAFRNRREAMSHFQDDFQEYAMEMLESREFVVQCAAVSCMVLFEQSRLLEMVQRVLDRKNRFLSDVVMKNCRTMTEIPSEIAHKMARHIVSVDKKTFVYQFRSMDFSLSLSKQLWYVRLVHAVRLLCVVLDYLMWTLFPVTYLYYAFCEVIIFPKARIGVVATGFIIFLTARIGITVIESEVGTLTVRNEIGNNVLILMLMLFTASGPLWFFMLVCATNFLYYLMLCWESLICRIDEISLKEHVIIFFSSIMSIVRIFVGACLTLLGVAFVAVLTVILNLKLDEVTLKWLNVLSASILPLLICICIISIFWRVIQQQRWLRHQPPVTTLDRSVLASNMEEHLLWESFKKHYLEDLVERKVKLTGEWPEGERPEMGQDDLERLLAILDCAGIDNLRMEF